MTILPLVVAPDLRLKKKSAIVSKIDDDIRHFIDDMLETMYSLKGLGLAAVQVGVLKRIVVIDVEYGSTRYENSEEKKTPNPIFFINPKIIESSKDMNVYEEGCLSFPGQYSDVMRPEKVKVRYLDYNGEEKILKASGLLATCVQHEIDHLNGIVFVDHISRTKRDMILKKLIKQQKHNL